MMRYELTDYEWAAIRPMLPNKARGVRRVDDRRVLNGICWVLRSGAPWRDLPDCYRPCTTCYNRFVRWRQRNTREVWPVTVQRRGDYEMANLRGDYLREVTA
jgi:transposase